MNLPKHPRVPRLTSLHAGLALFAFLVLAGTFVLPRTAAANPPSARVGVVDVEFVLGQLEDTKAVRSRLQSWIDGRRREIEADEVAVRMETEALRAQASTMSETLRAQKTAELQRRTLELTQRWERTRADSATRERKEFEPIMAKMDGVIATIAKRDALTLVIDKRTSGVRFMDTGHDITTDVIRAYNAAPPGKSK